MPEQITEARPLGLVEASASSQASETIPIVLITPGWGSSGYYSPQVLENAAATKVWPKGTQMYLDHPSESEMMDRPERSVRDLAAVLTEDAVWDGQGLVAEAKPVAKYRDMLTDRTFAEAIGVSIRATAEARTGEAAGRKGRIFTQLVEGISVDFVTKAGRGGKILTDLMESARPEQVVERAVRHGVEEATANDTRAALQDALKAAYGGPNSWVWVRDFDATTVWYEHETQTAEGIYAEGYTLDSAGVATLDGNQVEVRPRTQYVPVNPQTGESADVPTGDDDSRVSESGTDTGDTGSGDAPGVADDGAGSGDTQTSATESGPTAAEAADPSQEDAMPNTPQGAGGTAPQNPRQVMEARLADLTGQVAQMAARERARTIIDAELAEAWLPGKTIERLRGQLLESLPLVEETKELDEDALRTRCVEQRDIAESETAEALSAAGVGTPRGLGAMSTPAGGDATRFRDSARQSFIELGLSESAADIATKGRA